MIGAIAGGGKGAAIGAVIGAGGGVGYGLHRGARPPRPAARHGVHDYLGRLEGPGPEECGRAALGLTLRVFDVLGVSASWTASLTASFTAFLTTFFIVSLTSLSCEHVVADLGDGVSHGLLHADCERAEFLVEDLHRLLRRPWRKRPPSRRRPRRLVLRDRPVVLRWPSSLTVGVQSDSKVSMSLLTAFASRTIRPSSRRKSSSAVRKALAADEGLLPVADNRARVQALPGQFLHVEFGSLATEPMILISTPALARSCRMRSISGSEIFGS